MAYQIACIFRERESSDSTARLEVGAHADEGLRQEAAHVAIPEAPDTFIRTFTGPTAYAGNTTVAYHDSCPRIFASDRQNALTYVQNRRIGAFSRFRSIFTC